MPSLAQELNLPSGDQTPRYLTFDNFKKGVITLFEKSRIPKDALEAADNIFLVEDGMPAIRPGVDFFGAVMPNGEPIDGFDYFDLAGAIHLVAAAGGVFYRSLNDGETWTACTGGSYVAGTAVQMTQNSGKLYLTTGTATDNLQFYNGTTTIQSYTALATPAAPVVSQTGLGTTTFQYLYKVAAVNQVGFSAASVVGTGVTKFTTTRDQWDVAKYASVAIPATTGATRYDVYISEDGVDYYYVNSVVPATVGAAATFVDDGTSIVIPSTTAPTANTTQGPRVAQLVNVGSRMYGVRDYDNPYRIWFTGAGTYSGAFSHAYDGGYLEWQPGGKLLPVQVADYRKGNNDPIATIWCDSADGQGGILQMSLDTITIGDISVTVPSAFQLPGARGTPAPGSVVNVLNDYMFYNSQAIYNLGSRAQFLNLLSTDEASANIRPSVKQITSEGEAGIASVYYDAKVFMSVPYTGDTNSATIVYDTERKAWLPRAFTIGFKKFLKYTDTDGNRHLLALKEGDNQLSEIDDAIQGDYGEPFTSFLSTGLMPISKNRFEFQFVEEAEIEFSNPQDDITIDLLGIDRKEGYGIVATKILHVPATISGEGWDTFGWDSEVRDDTDTVPQPYSEPSVKRYFPVQKELNAIQWNITTHSISARYTGRVLQTWGTDTNAGKPRHWRIGSRPIDTSSVLTNDNNEPLYI